MRTIKYFKPIGIAVFIGLLFCQCTDIDNDRRLLVRGNVTDSNNQAVANSTIQTKAGNAVLGGSVSDEFGSFEFVSLVTGMSLQVEIPENMQFTYADGSGSISSFSIPIRGTNENLLEINQLRILPFAEVKFNFVRQNNNEQVDVLLERQLFQSLNENVFNYQIEEIDYSQEITPFFNREFILFIPQNENFQLREIVKKNETYRMSYQLENNESIQLIFEINEDYNEFEINL